MAVDGGAARRHVARRGALAAIGKVRRFMTAGAARGFGSDRFFQSFRRLFLSLPPDHRRPLYFATVYIHIN